MGKSKKKSKSETDTDSDTESRTESQTESRTDSESETNTKKKNKKSKKNKGFIDKFVNLNTKTKTYLSIICMLLIFAGFIWYRQKNKTQTQSLNTNQVGSALEQNLENLKQTVSEIIDEA